MVTRVIRRNSSIGMKRKVGSPRLVNWLSLRRYSTPSRRAAMAPASFGLASFCSEKVLLRLVRRLATPG
jgi:hypothetical protein